MQRLEKIRAEQDEMHEGFRLVKLIESARKDQQVKNAMKKRFFGKRSKSVKNFSRKILL